MLTKPTKPHGYLLNPKSAERVQYPAVNYVEMTCVFFIKRDDDGIPFVFLVVKKDKIGKGKRTGYGGKTEKEQEETPRQCAGREITQESSGAAVDIQDLELAAFGDFTTLNHDHSETIRHIHFFTCQKWVGTFRDSAETCDGKWYRFNELPIEELMPADPYWLEQVLTETTSGQNDFFEINAKYGPEQRTLLEQVVVTPGPRPFID